MKTLPRIRKIINPPYSSKDLLVILGLLVVLVSIPLTVSLSLQRPSFAPRAADLPIELDSSSLQSAEGTVSSLSWSHNCSGSDRVLIVGVSLGGNRSVASLTYAGVGLTKLFDAKTGSLTTDTRIELWWVKCPAVGSNTINLTLNGSSLVAAGATSWKGVNQTTPLGAYNTNTGSSQGPNVSLNSAANEKVVDVFGTYTTVWGESLHAGTGQTQHWGLWSYGNSGPWRGGGGSSKQGAASVSMFWTLTSSMKWAAGVVALKPAPAPPPLAPTADIKASNSDGPITITYNTSATITWNSANANLGCSVSPSSWTGTSGSQPTGNLTLAKTYTLNCSGNGGTVTDSVVVNVTSPPGGGSTTSGGGTSSGGSAGSNKPGSVISSSGGTGSGKLENLNLEVTVPYLVGELKVKAEIGSFQKEINISRNNNQYSLEVKEANLALNKAYTIILTSGKTLVRKLSFSPTAIQTTINLGDLILGDLNQDNTIDDKDSSLLVGSISNQTIVDDINGDKVVNSFDWAILLANFGKKGD